MSQSVTKAKVMNYFSQVYKNHWDNVMLETNMTSLSEDAQNHFGVMTDMGQTDIEQDIEDWSAEFCYDLETK